MRTLPVHEYEQAVHASWLGQMVGNIYGLGYEFKFIDEPGPDKFPYGYASNIERVRELDGAFSDDDTDVEYMYLVMMEERGIEPTYRDFAESWKRHVHKDVWCANRAAVTLMHAGHYPPASGSKHINPEWCQIDPQLVNEIWAVTAPGMTGYAVEKSRHAARVMSDSFGLEPTLHYAAMFSEAFFVKDIGALVDHGTSVLPADSYFARIARHVRQLHREHPGDWQAARRIVVENYFGPRDYNKLVWPPVDANLNGALGLLALLYGDGDFQLTLDLSCAMGMDADNQAATMCGLLGIVNGLDSIPRDLLHPLDDREWEKPFNDLYKVVTREDLPDASIADMAARMAAQGRNVILAKGGEVVDIDGIPHYRIPADAEYVPPFEINAIPPFFVEAGQGIRYPIHAGGRPGEATVRVDGDIPAGVRLAGGELVGAPAEPGDYQFALVAERAGEQRRTDVRIRVHAPSLAASAAEVLSAPGALEPLGEILRDGDRQKTHYSTKADNRRELDWYGYRWDQPVRVTAISYSNGLPQEQGGWFTSLDVEYLRDGAWTPVEDLKIEPPINLDNSHWLKPRLIDYELTFRPVETTAIRIVGMPGGHLLQGGADPRDARFFSSIAELRVYAD